MAKHRKYERLGPSELSAEDAAEFEQQIAEADQELEEARVNFRWGKEQVDLVKQVAKLIGVPYQTYIKQTLYRSCLEDLKNFEERKRYTS
jgi:predicted DNA binding CopG/RHH family protein